MNFLPRDYVLTPLSTALPLPLFLASSNNTEPDRLPTRSIMEDMSPRHQTSAARRLSLGSPSSGPRRPSHGSVETPETSGHERKRRRTSNLERHANETIESVDLTSVEGTNSVSRTQAKQRADAILAQQSLDDGQGRSVLTAYKCPVCMDTPVDATSTACGTFNAKIL